MPFFDELLIYGIFFNSIILLFRRSSQRGGAGGLEETYENFTFGEPKDRPASLRLENR